MIVSEVKVFFPLNNEGDFKVMTWRKVSGTPERIRVSLNKWHAGKWHHANIYNKKSKEFVKQIRP